MKNSLFVTFGMAALCALPGALGAQPPVASSVPTQVQINVDYITTSFVNYFNQSSHIAPGKEHDALLLAALLKDGAYDEQAPQITTTDGVSGSISIQTQLPAPFPPLTSSVQVQPSIITNGIIRVDIKSHQETLFTAPGATKPTVKTVEGASMFTFMDGQTLLVNYGVGSRQGTGSPPLLIIFATVKSIVMPSRVHAAPPASHT